jgi:hypothetical protein
LPGGEGQFDGAPQRLNLPKEIKIWFASPSRQEAPETEQDRSEGREHRELLSGVKMSA